MLEEAFTGYFTSHHAFLLGKMLARVDAISADIAALDARIEAEITPFAATVSRLDEIPGINLAAACVIIAEIGLDMARFPTAGHLVSWAKYAPGVKESACAGFYPPASTPSAAAVITSASSKHSVTRSFSNAPLSLAATSPSALRRRPTPGRLQLGPSRAAPPRRNRATA